MELKVCWEQNRKVGSKSQNIISEFETSNQIQYFDKQVLFHSTS